MKGRRCSSEKDRLEISWMQHPVRERGSKMEEIRVEYKALLDNYESVKE